MCTIEKDLVIIIAIILERLGMNEGAERWRGNKEKESGKEGEGEGEGEREREVRKRETYDSLAGP